MRIEISNEIYTKLSGITTNVHSDLLPVNFDFSNNAIVFKFQTNNSTSSYQGRNLFNDYSLFIKVYSKSKVTMYSLTEQIKTALLVDNYSTIYDIEFENAVDVYDYDNKVFINNPTFTISAEN